MHEFTPQTCRYKASTNIHVYGAGITACVRAYSDRDALACRAQAERLDQFYTRPDVAIDLYATFRRFYDPAKFLMVEPSAGAGAFFAQLPPGSLGFDLMPAAPGIVAADFLKEDLGEYTCSGRGLAVIGNPPFGWSACSAIAFFNHAARWADVIAFILPCSIRKFSVENRLAQQFHLIHEEDVPCCAFLHDGAVHDVRTIFQIWERRTTPRVLKPTAKTHPDFRFTTPEQADFVIRRNGANAGRVFDRAEGAAKSYYYIKGPVRAIMEQLDFTIFDDSVTGARSLSKAEIVFLYSQNVSAGSRSNR